MYSRSSIASLALTIAFAMAFALTVALVSISSAQLDEKSPTAQSTTQAPTTEATTTLEPRMLLEFTSNQNGTCALTGIGSCTDATIVIPAYSPAGDRVTSISPRALYGCATVVSIHIPETVAFIGNLAFGDCKNLSFITVSNANLAYRAVDGVLYSADLSVLILYPARRVGAELFIGAETTAIREMAFFECTHLQRIRYAGSAAQWEEISVGSKNYALHALSKEFEAKR